MKAKTPGFGITRKHLRIGVSGLLILAASIRFIWAGLVYSKDFEVYWSAIQAWGIGDSPYGALVTGDPAFVFKYPPWLLPFFSPLYLIDFPWAKGIWAVLCVGMLFSSVRSLIRLGLSKQVALITMGLFWYILLGHFYFGQITLFVLAVSLWAVEKKSKWDQNLRTSILVLVMTAKAFSLVSLVGVSRNVFKLRVLYIIFIGMLIAHVFLYIFPWVFLGTPLEHFFHPFDFFRNLYSEYLVSMGSGASRLGADIVRGQANHGFVAGVLRIIDPQAQRPFLDIPVFLGLAVLLGGTWAKVSKGLTFPSQWAGWLAYGVVVHPLAWHHSFVLTIPLVAFSLHYSAQNWPRQKVWMVLSLVGVALIGWIVPNVVGSLVRPFELGASKSWGVLLCALAMVGAYKKSKNSLTH